MRLGTADVLVRAKTDKYNKELATAETRVRTFGKRAVASIAGVTAAFASLAGVAGIAGLSVSMVKTGARFESSMGYGSRSHAGV